MIKQFLMLVLVLISSTVLAQDVVTQGNRVEQQYNTYTQNNTWATAIDKDPQNTDPGTDPIVRARSRVAAKNMANGFHHWSAVADVRCFSNEYKGTWGLDTYTPHKFRGEFHTEEPSGNGSFHGIFRKPARVGGRVLGAFDCRISVGKCRSNACLTVYKINESESGGPAAWATSSLSTLNLVGRSERSDLRHVLIVAKMSGFVPLLDLHF